MAALDGNTIAGTLVAVRELWEAQRGGRVRRLSARAGNSRPVPTLRRRGDGHCRGPRVSCVDLQGLEALEPAA